MEKTVEKVDGFLKWQKVLILLAFYAHIHRHFTQYPYRNILISTNNSHDVDKMKKNYPCVYVCG